jgi:hypothetical protein
MGDNMAQTKTGETVPVTIDEKGCGFIEANRTSRQVGFDGSNRFGP